LPKSWGDWALVAYPRWTAAKVLLEADRFADHWHSKAGREAVKLDWLATWRNWCRSDMAHKDDPKPNGSAGHAAEPAWRTEQRERNEAYLGPAAVRRRPATTTIEAEAHNAAPDLLGLPPFRQADRALRAGLHTPVR
jgi:hypothetical protein